MSPTKGAKVLPAYRDLEETEEIDVTREWEESRKKGG